MRGRALVLAALMLTAGCLGQVGTEEDPNANRSEADTAPPEGGTSRRIERTLVFQANVSGPQPGGERLGIEWTSELGIGLAGLRLELSWQRSSNGFGIETERPDGTVHKTGPPSDPGATSASSEVTQLGPGEYTFNLKAADGVVLPDTVQLRAHVTWELLNGTQPAVENGTMRGPVRTEPTDDGWRATIRYQANGSASETMKLHVNTTNGALAHRGTAEQATATVLAYARGDTEEEARRRVLEIDVDLRIEQGRIVASATAPNWEKRGANVDTGVPEQTSVTGAFETTNGAITFRQARTHGLTAETTNGAIEGQLTGQGSIQLDTTNGAIAIDLTPTGDTELHVASTNGAHNYGLAETEEIGYTIDASLTNGEITEEMEEASLQGGDEEATLRTNDASSRPIQVTGSVETTNGNIHFEAR